MTSDSKKTARAVKSILPWAVSAGLIIFIILTNDIGRAARVFGRVEWAVYLGVTIPFLVLLLLTETVFLLLGFRWFAGVGGFSDLLRARAATYLLTIVSIFVGLGGIMVYGKRRYGVSYSAGTTIALNELLHELASQCTLALMVGLLLPERFITEAALPAVTGVTLAGMIGVGAYLFILVISRLSRFLPPGLRRVKALDRFVDVPLKHYAVFYLIKLAQNIIYGLFLAGLLLAFAVRPPLIVSVGFMQIIHLTRAIPVSAFGIGVDQVAMQTLFQAWESPGSGSLLAASVVFTATLIFGRALLGAPFIKGVLADLIEQKENG